MTAKRLGVAVDDLGVDPKEGLHQAARLGYGTVELRTCENEVDPANLSQTGVRHLRKFTETLGLEIAVLSGPTGRGGVGDPAVTEYHVDKTRRILELAAKLSVPVVTVRLDAIPEEPDDRRRRLITEALDHLGEHADKTGTFLAVLAAEHSPLTLRRLLDDLNCPMLRVGYDPGALLIRGYDPIAGVGELAGHIAASHLRDATRGTPATAGREVRMGTGQVPFLEYLAALEEGQYTGPHIVRRTDAADPLAEFAAARQYLERLLR